MTPTQYHNEGYKHPSLRYCHDTNALEVHAHAEFEWLKGHNVLKRRGCKFIIDYENDESTTFTNLGKPKGATTLYMRVYFENKLVCYMCWHLADAAMM